MFYDPKKKRIVDYGSSRPCGSNMNRFSIHAEQKAIEFCRKCDKRNRYQIYISRYNKNGIHKPTYCCFSCKQFASLCLRDTILFCIVLISESQSFFKTSSFNKVLIISAA